MSICATDSLDALSQGENNHCAPGAASIHDDTTSSQIESASFHRQRTAESHSSDEFQSENESEIKQMIPHAKIQKGTNELSRMDVSNSGRLSRISNSVSSKKVAVVLAMAAGFATVGLVISSTFHVTEFGYSFGES